MVQMIYFAIRCTENYKSDNVVVGIYTSVDRAINRIEDLCDSRRKTGAFSTYWKDENYRYFIKSFPLGDCPTEANDIITTRGIVWRV